MSLRIYPLGQVGYLFDFDGVRIVIDPYLTDSVADQFGEPLRRMSQPTLAAESLTGVSLVLLTHAHLDHTDPVSLAALFAASPKARFVAPYECIPILISSGIPAAQLSLVSAGDSLPAVDELRIRAVPAAHTELETDTEGRSRYLGYYLETPSLCLYHAGDTIPHDAIFSALEGRRIDYAFLPVNECNFFRARAGIVGNMTSREAFAMAERLGVRHLVPTHWDLFAPNSTYPWEVEALHTAMKPSFGLRFMPCGAAYSL